MRHVTSLIRLHWEKTVLVLSLLVLAASFRWRLVESPNAVVLIGQIVRPCELHTVLLDEAQALEQSIDAAISPPSAAPPHYPSLRRVHDRGVFARFVADGAAPISRRLPRCAPLGVDIPKMRDIVTNARIVTPSAPVRPETSTDLSLVATQEANVSAGPAERATRVSWVRVTSSFPEREYARLLLAAGYPPFMANVYLVRVEAQRRERLAEGGFSKWVTLASQTTSAVAEPPSPAYDDDSGTLLNRAELSAAYQLVRATQSTVARPDFPPVLAGATPTARRQVSVSEGQRGIWFDDTEAVAGREYQYRLRAHVWNRLAGRRHMVANLADADESTIAGAWSEPSESVVAAADTHIFVQGPGTSDDAVNCEVWRWIEGKWLRKTFETRVGDSVGGPAFAKVVRQGETGGPRRERVDFQTGLILLSTRREPQMLRTTVGTNGRFNLRKESGVAVVLLDSDTGRTFERTQTADRNDPTRKWLRRP